MPPVILTRKPRTHNAIAAIWRYDRDKQLELLVVTVRHRDARGHVVGDPQIKLPGGGSSRSDEPVLVTVGREVLEETHLFIDPASAEEVWSQKMDPDHTRFGFIIPFDSCLGSMRRTTIFEEDGDEVSEPRFVRAFELRSKIILAQLPVVEAVILNTPNLR